MKRILIVDDEYFEREAFKMVIAESSSDFKVTAEAENGMEAIGCIERDEADIVFMDIQMPRMNGIEAAKRIKEIRPQTVIIMLTAYSEFDLVHSALKLHVDDYLLKPCRPEVILEAVTSAVKLSKEKAVSLGGASVQKDLKASLKRAFLSGDYIQSKQLIGEIVHKHHFSVEDEIEDMKEILTLVEQVAEHFKIDIKKNSQLRAMEKLKAITKKDEYFALIDYLVEEIFEIIIRDKLAVYPREMDYALQYIEKNIAKRVTLEDVASFMNISPHYFSKLFKNEVGINFIDYMTERKILRSKELIAGTTEPINNIAFELGFNEANYFSKVFKKITGISPSEFRRQKEIEKEEVGTLVSRSYVKSNTKWIV